MTTATNSFPVIAGIQVVTDAEGRYNLNALHRASGLGKAKQPTNWLRLDGTKELVEELNSSDVRSLPVTNISGRNGGTFAVEQLAVAYATWISPRFYLMVIEVFIAFKTGQIQKMSPLDRMNDLVVRDRISRAKAAEASRDMNQRQREQKVLAIEAKELLDEFQLMLPLDTKLIMDKN